MYSGWSNISLLNICLSFCDCPLTFWAPSLRIIFCTLILLSQLHELWSQTLRERSDATLLPSRVYLQEFLLQFSEEDRQRSKMAYRSLFVVNISPSFGEFTAPLRHILPIHNVTTNSNNLFVNFLWTFTFRVEKSYDGTHLAFGGTLDRRCHFKHVSLKCSRFYHCQTSAAHT